MTRSLRIAALLAVAVALTAPGALPVRAAGVPAPTSLQLSVPPRLATGQALPVTATLTSQGQPLAGALVHLELDSSHETGLVTDAEGSVSARLPLNVPLGTHTLSAMYAGSGGAQPLAPANAAVTFVVGPQANAGLTLQAPATVVFAHAAPIDVRLVASGQPVARALVHVYINGVDQLGLSTDGGGRAEYRMRRSTPPGTYSITAVFGGDRTRGLGAATASGQIRVLPPSGTAVAVSVPPPTKAGQEIPIEITTTGAAGPLPRATVHLSVGGVESLDLQSDGAGVARFRMRRSTPAGSYPVTVTYHGSQPAGLASASDQTTLTVLPLTVVVQTLPALPGTAVTLDGTARAADAHGAATFSVAATGDHQVSVGASPATAGTRATFQRWADGLDAPARQIRVLGDTKVFAGYQASILTPITFADSDGRRVSSTRVSDVSVIGPDGVTQALSAPYAPMWLSFPAPSRASLTVGRETAHFSVVSARFDGIPVVDRGDDVLLPRPGETWQIRLRLYTLTVVTHHPVLPGGGPYAVRVTSSHRPSFVVPLQDGQAVVPDLPRDHYTVEVPASAYAPATPVALSRSQSVEIVVIGLQDVLVMLLAASAFVALLVILARRPHLLQPVERAVRRSVATTAARWRR